MLTTAIILVILGIIGVIMGGSYSMIGWALIIIGIIVYIVKMVKGKKNTPTV